MSPRHFWTLIKIIASTRIRVTIYLLSLPIPTVTVHELHTNSTLFISCHRLNRWTVCRVFIQQKGHKDIPVSWPVMTWSSLSHHFLEERRRSSRGCRSRGTLGLIVMFLKNLATKLKCWTPRFPKWLPSFSLLYFGHWVSVFFCFNNTEKVQYTCSFRIV